MSGMTSRNKGKRGEREVVKLLNKVGYIARRGVQFSGGPDSPDIVSNCPYHIEVKYTEKLRIYDAIEQATQDSGKKTPVVFYRKNGEDWLVIIKADDFLRHV